MAKNKERLHRERWLRQREGMSKRPGDVRGPLRPKAGWRYIYEKRVTGVEVQSVEDTWELLHAQRAELIVTLHMLGATFYDGGQIPTPQGRAFSATTITNYDGTMGAPETSRVRGARGLSSVLRLIFSTSYMEEKGGPGVWPKHGTPRLLRHYAIGTIMHPNLFPSEVPRQALATVKFSTHDPALYWEAVDVDVARFGEYVDVQEAIINWSMGGNPDDNAR